jgi:hypothetical protein
MLLNLSLGWSKLSDDDELYISPKGDNRELPKCWQIYPTIIVCTYICMYVHVSVCACVCTYVHNQSMREKKFHVLP